MTLKMVQRDITAFFHARTEQPNRCQKAMMIFKYDGCAEKNCRIEPMTDTFNNAQQSKGEKKSFPVH